MELEQVKGNTWVLKSWQMIPFYRLDERRCVFLDSGLARERVAIQDALVQFGLMPVGVICSHAHIDHMGNNAYWKKHYGTELAMSLGEAALQASHLGLNTTNYGLSPKDVVQSPDLGDTPILVDRIILPQEDRITFCGADFDIIHTPGHTIDHICVRTPDDVLYLGDAMMTGRTLHNSKFPFAFSMQGYLDSMRSIRWISASRYVVAHYGIYDEILPLVDMEARFLAERMLHLLAIVGEAATPKRLAAAICETYGIRPKDVQDFAYFEQSSQSYLHYLCDLGYLEPSIEANFLTYRPTEKVAEYMKKQAGETLPPTGQFR